MRRTTTTTRSLRSAPASRSFLLSIANPTRGYAQSLYAAGTKKRTDTSIMFGRGRTFPLRGVADDASRIGGKTADAATTVDLTHVSPVIFARRTPEERRRDQLGVQKILEVAKRRANEGEKENGLLKFLGFYGKKNQCLRGGSALYANVFYRSLDEEFYDLLGYEEKGLLPWFLISTLHMWMTSVRLRKDPSSRAVDTRIYFADSFWMDVEEKLNVNVGVNYVGMGKAFKQLPNLYAHTTISLDKALKSPSDDQALGDALFRHIFFNRLPHQSHMTALISYVRQELAHLDTISNNLLLHGYLPWGSLPRPVPAIAPDSASTEHVNASPSSPSSSSSSSSSPTTSSSS